MPEEELLRFVPVHRKLLLYAFVKEKLAPFAARSLRKLEDENSLDTLEMSQPLWNPDTGCVNLSCRVVSVTLNNHRVSKKLVSTCMLRKFLSEELDRERTVQLDAVRALDHSRCYLVEDDLEFIHDLCCDTLRHCSVVDLSLTRLGFRLRSSPTYEKRMKEFLALPSVRYVDVTGTVLATFESQDFFRSLPLWLVRKLIFIPANHLSRDSWRPLVNHQFLRPIRKAHHVYFDLQAHARGIRTEKLARVRGEPELMDIGHSPAAHPSTPSKTPMGKDMSP